MIIFIIIQTIGIQHMKKLKKQLLLTVALLIITISCTGGMTAAGKEKIKNNTGTLNNLVIYVGFKNSATAGSYISDKDISAMNKF